MLRALLLQIVNVSGFRQAPRESADPPDLEHSLRFTQAGAAVLDPRYHATVPGTKTREQVVRISDFVS